MIIQPKFLASGLEQAEAYALSFWLNQKTRSQYGLEYRHFQSHEAVMWLDDVSEGKHSWDQSCKATQETWKAIRGASALHNESMRVANGIDVVKQRALKAEKVKDARKYIARLVSDTDPCIDILGKGRSIEILTAQQQAEKVAELNTRQTVFNCRLKAMSNYLKYFGQGSFYLMAGGSGTGKTTLALQALEDVKTIYINLDMNLLQTVKRIFEIHSYKILPRDVPFNQKREIVAKAWESSKQNPERILERLNPNLTIIDYSSLSIEELWSKIDELKQSNSLPYSMVIDYMDKMDTDEKFEKDHEKRKYIGRKFKELANTFGVSILGLCQYMSSYEPFKVGQANWIQGSKDLIATSDGCICIWRSKARSEQSGQEVADPSHIWVSNSIKNRDTGYMDDARIDCIGLYLENHVEEWDDSFM